MVGWGHLRLPFLFGREAEVRGGANQASHASSIGGERRSRWAGRPEARHTKAGKPKIGNRIHGGRRVVKCYYKGLVNRSNGAESQKRSLVAIELITNCYAGGADQSQDIRDPVLNETLVLPPS
jgi:hypothetical protein